MKQLTAIWAWMAGNTLALIIVGVAAFFLFTRMQSCRDKGDSQFDAVMVERIRVDSIRAVADSIALADARQQLSMALANGVKVVDRWRESAPQPIRPGTTRDTLTQLVQQVRACRQAGDSLVASIVEIQTACTSYRDTATKAIANLREGIARRDSLLDRRVVEKRVQPYGDALYDAVNRRPVFRLGTTTKLLWKLHGKVEGEYAIPSATKSESGDGFRVLAGATLRF